MNLSQAQKRIVQTKEPRVVVLASAASGKTTVITERARYLLNNGYNASKIVMITFTNAAAEVMRERLGSDCDEMFIGTIHSYCNYLLRAHGIETGSFLDEERFDELFDLISENPEAIQEVDYLMLDESQDSTKLEFDFLLKMVQPHEFMFLGDTRQCIYEWRDASPDTLIELIHDPKVTVYPLIENYRNGAAILSYAKNFIDPLGPEYEDNSICRSGLVGSVKEMQYSLSRMAKIIQDTPKYGKWFILARNNNQVATIYNYLQGCHIPVDTFKRGDLTLEELQDHLSSDSVKVLTVHAAKGLENDYVIVQGCVPTVTVEERRICYVAATRAKKRLYWIYTAPRKHLRRESDIVSWE